MKNKGFSLIEVIIAIAVLAILTTGVITMTGAHFGWRVNKAVQLTESAMNKTMVQAMGKGDVKGLLLYQKDGTYYAVILKNSCKAAGSSLYTLESSNEVERFNLGNQPMVIKALYKRTDGSGGTKTVELANYTSETGMSDVAELLYDKSSGAILPVTINGEDYRYTGIQIECQGRVSLIDIYAATGKHELHK